MARDPEPLSCLDLQLPSLCLLVLFYFIYLLFNIWLIKIKNKKEEKKQKYGEEYNEGVKVISGEKACNWKKWATSTFCQSVAHVAERACEGK